MTQARALKKKFALQLNLRINSRKHGYCEQCKKKDVTKWSKAFGSRVRALTLIQPDKKQKREFTGVFEDVIVSSVQVECQQISRKSKVLRIQWLLMYAMVLYFYFRILIRHLSFRRNVESKRIKSTPKPFAPCNNIRQSISCPRSSWLKGRHFTISRAKRLDLNERFIKDRRTRRK